MADTKNTINFKQKKTQIKDTKNHLFLSYFVILCQSFFLSCVLFLFNVLININTYQKSNQKDNVRDINIKVKLIDKKLFSYGFMKKKPVQKRKQHVCLLKFNFLIPNVYNNSIIYVREKMHIFFQGGGIQDDTNQI